MEWQCAQEKKKKKSEEFHLKQFAFKKQKGRRNGMYNLGGFTAAYLEAE